MSISIRNSTPNTVYVAVAYYNGGCSPRYGKRGWYSVAPGRTRVVYGGRFNYAYFRYYAEDSFGNVWDGNNFTNVPDDPFDTCWIANCSPGTSCRRLGFRDPGYFNCTFLCTEDKIINLVLSSSRKQSKSRKILIALPTKRKLKYRKHPHGILKKTKFQTTPKPGNTRITYPTKRKLTSGANRMKLKRKFRFS